jgi:hypothetical protein
MAGRHAAAPDRHAPPPSPPFWKDEGGRLKEYPWPDRTPEQDLAEAANLIEITGYHRRDEEVKDLSLVIGQ